MIVAVGMATAPLKSHTATIKTFKFRPDTLVVQAGDSVVWTNEDDIAHTVTSDSSVIAGGRFDRALDARGARAAIRFTQAGIYPYHCDRHAFMRGVVRVTSTGAHP